MGVVNVQTMEQCVRACDSTDGCVAFAYVSSDNDNVSPCYLKNEIGERTLDSGVWGGYLMGAECRRLGCYTEGSESRAFPDYPMLMNDTMTPQMCEIYCSDFGTTYYGIEYGMFFISSLIPFPHLLPLSISSYREGSY